MATWYVIRNGQEHGPYDARQLRAVAARGKLKPKYRLRRSDQTETVPATDWEPLLAAEVEVQPGMARVKAVVDRVSPLQVVAALLALVAVGIAVTRLVEDEPPLLPAAALPVAGLPAATTGAAENEPAKSEPAKSEPAKSEPAIPKTIYWHDFARDDLSIPVGGVVETRQATFDDEAESLLRGLPATFAGYVLPSGVFHRHGSWTVWWDEARTKPAKQGGMWRDRQHGEVLTFATDGRKVARERWVYGLRHGGWATVDETGVALSIDRYFNGVLEGKAERWHANGTLQAETHWRAGKQHGVARTWLEDGTLASEVEYADGEIVR